MLEGQNYSQASYNKETLENVKNNMNNPNAFKHRNNT